MKKVQALLKKNQRREPDTIIFSGVTSIRGWDVRAPGHQAAVGSGELGKEEQDGESPGRP